jgi:hypothetical protein
MGTVLEEALPESEDIRINGEVPGVTDAISQQLGNTAIKRLLSRTREVRKHSPKDSQIAIQLPNEGSEIPHDVLLDDVTFQRDLENQRFLATFPEHTEAEAGKRITKEKTIALSIGAALVAAGTIYAVRRQIKK